MTAARRYAYLIITILTFVAFGLVRELFGIVEGISVLLFVLVALAAAIMQLLVIEYG